VGAGRDRWAPYQTVARLLALVTDNWNEIDGACLLRGIDIAELPWPRALNLVYALIMDGKDEKERLKIENELLAPLPGSHMSADEEFWAGAEADSALFMKALQSTENPLG